MAMNFNLGILLAISATTLWSGCDEDKVETGEENGNDTPADYEIFDVEWVEGIAVLDDVAAVRDAVASMDYETGTLVLNPSFEGTDRLIPGTTALVGGLGIFRVVDRTATEEGVRFSLENAPLTDVVENGTIAWRRDFMKVHMSEKVGLGIGESESATIREMTYPLSGSYEGDALSFEGEISGFTTSFSLAGEENTYSMKLRAERAGDDAIAAKVVVEGELTGLAQEPPLEIQERSVTDFSVRLENLNGKLSLSAGAVELGKGEVGVSVPARISIPVVVGGIPFRIDLGGSLEIQSSIVNQTSAILRATTAFSGNCGFTFDGTEFRSLNEIEATEVKRGSVEHVGAVTSGLGILINFPEVGIGIGVPSLTEGRAFVRLKSEIVSNMMYFYDVVGPMIVPDGACVETGVNFGAYYGGSLQFAGLFDFETEHPIYTFLGEKSYMGDACEQ